MLANLFLLVTGSFLLVVLVMIVWPRKDVNCRHCQTGCNWWNIIGGGFICPLCGKDPLADPDEPAEVVKARIRQKFVDRFGPRLPGDQVSRN